MPCAIAASRWRASTRRRRIACARAQSGSSSETRWRAFIDQWSVTESLQEQVKLAKEAKQWREREPVPPSLAVDYQRLSSEADQAARRLFETQREIKKWFDEVEEAVRRESVHHALRYGAAALHRQQAMSKSGAWPRAMMDECEQIIEFAREVIEPGIQRFTLTQHCGAAQQIAAFRETMQSEVGWLKDLGYLAEANRHLTQGQRVIHSIELRAEWQDTLARCQDYPRQPTPGASTPGQDLTDEIKQGDELLEVLGTIPATVLSDAEKHAHRSAISTRQGVLKQSVDERNAALTALDDLRILNAEMLAEARAEVERVRLLFVGRRDEEQINDLAKLIDRIKADMVAWDAGAVSVERLSELLTDQLTHQLGDLQVWLEQMDIEPPMQWDLETIYRALAAEQVEGARRRSTDWLRPRLLDDDAIAQMDQARCDALVQELANAPGYLADADASVVARQLAALRQRQATLAEQARAAKVAAWRAQLAPAQQPAALDRASTEALLKTLENPPCLLAPDETSWQRTVAAGLTARLDELSLDDLLERIARLSPELRGQLLNRLQELV